VVYRVNGFTKTCIYNVCLQFFVKSFYYKRCHFEEVSGGRSSLNRTMLTRRYQRGAPMLQMRGNNAFKCFRNCRQFRDFFIVLSIHLRTLFVEWNNKGIFPDSRKNSWWDRQMKKFKNGFTKSSSTKIKHTPRESIWPRRIGWRYSF